MADAFPKPTPPVKKSPSKSLGLQRRLSPALASVAKRSVVAEPEEIASYRPREIDVSICESMLAGAGTFTEIAEASACSPGLVSQALRDPVACGWISQQVHRAIHTRLGLVDAAVYRRAVAGDIRAADLLYRRWGGIVDRSISLHLDGKDLAKMSDADLEAIIRAETTTVTTGRQDSSNSGHAGAPSKTVLGAPAVLPAP